VSLKYNHDLIMNLTIITGKEMKGEEQEWTNERKK
jgi:hypothetical protein